MLTQLPLLTAKLQLRYVNFRKFEKVGKFWKLGVGHFTSDPATLLASLENISIKIFAMVDNSEKRICLPLFPKCL